MPDPTHTDELDKQLADVLDHYLELLERGERLDHDQLIADHPEIAESLRDALMSIEFVAFAAAGERSTEKKTDSGDRGDLERERLGDYQIVREIGRGGMAVVYEAQQLSLGRRVALKVLPFVSVLDSRQLARFRNEAQAAALLTHQNIVPVYSVGCERGVHFFAMQFIEGQSLAAFIRQMRGLRPEYSDTPSDEPEYARTEGDPVPDRPKSDTLKKLTPTSPENAQRETIVVNGMSTERTSRWPDYWRMVTGLAIQACDALDYAHRQGVLHRDIKPANLVLDTTGNLWVTDFGLARIENNVSLTMTGDLLGTLRYMSPEQAMAKRPLIDHRSDIYSLGATLFELLTLEPAIQGNNREEVIREIAFDDPQPARRVNSGIPRELETVVSKSMAKHPADRYQTAQQLGDDLRRFLDHKPILAKPPTVIHRIGKWTRRHKAFVATALCGLVVSLLVALVSLAYSNYWIDQERQTALASEKLRRQQLVETHIQRSAALRGTETAGRRALALDALRHARGLLKSLETNEFRTMQIRNETIACLVTTDLNESRFLINPITNWVDFDRQLTKYSSCDDQNNIMIRRVHDGSLLTRLPSHDARILSAIFSPDGRFLAAVDELDSCVVWDLSCNSIVFETPVFRSSFDFSPDSGRIAFGQSDGSIRVFETDSTQLICQLKPGVAPQSLRFSPDGRKIAVCGHESTRIQIRDLETDSVIEEFSDHLAFLGDVCWSQDGNRLAAGCLDGRVYVWDLKRHKLQALMKHQRQVIRVRFNPQGNLLASTGHDGITRLWQSDSGRLLAKAKGHFVDFDSTGRLLAFQNRQGVGIWEITNDSSLQTLASKLNPNGAWLISLDPQQELLASAGHHGVVIWHVRSGTELALIPLDDCGAVTFDSSGTSLFIASRSGLHRWPLLRNHNSGTIVCGPPTWIADLPGYSPKICLSANDRYLAFVNAHDSVKILDLSSPVEFQILKGHPDVHYVCLSEDGRWAATCAKPGHNAMIWDIESGDVVATCVATHDNAPVFSPDSKWFATVTAREYRLYETGSWELKWRIPLTQSRLGAITFSPDSAIAAFYQSPGLINLVESGTGKPLGVLEPPEPNVGSWMQFNSTGKILAVAAVDRIHVWNFDMLTGQLSEMGLDWPMDFFDEKTPTLGVGSQIPDFRLRHGKPADADRHHNSGTQIEKTLRQMSAFFKPPGNSQPTKELFWKIQRIVKAVWPDLHQ